jgi:hypothetical protein|tara:strand:- start:4 stop:1419 length:1416 start_codon:yes stop_codon:yes gene_type:complete
MGAIIEVKYFNSFVLKKVNNSVNPLGGGEVPDWNGSLGIPEPIGGYPALPAASIGGSNWAIEEARIRGGYNNTNVDYGVRAYLVEEEPNASIRSNSLIYSGIFNSRTGINDTNVFSVAESITKSADPANGSIQRLYAEDTNLIIFQEAKVSRALIDKDAIYSAEGGGSITNVNTTIGTIQPYAGNFGISRDPGSFAVYGYRKYFTDKDRNAVLRLSMDGLTEISNYGMYDYFRDEFNNIDSGTLQGTLLGGWDIHNKQYVLSSQTNLINPVPTYNTLSFDESVRGWTSFFSYKPDHVFSLRNNLYTMKDGDLWLHYDNSVDRGSFYSATTPASVTFVFNPSISMSKVFKTVSYEGSNGWQVNSFTSDATGYDSFSPHLFSDSTKLVYSYDGGKYIEGGVVKRAGFDRKENKYHANLINNTSAREAEIVWGNSVSGIKGFYCTVKVSTDNTTDVGGAKELFAVSSNYVESSY